MIEKTINNNISSTPLSEKNKNQWIKDKAGLLVLICIVVFSFLLYMYSLVQYPISYGPDGPYYDLQVRHILRTGFPESNDAPLVYYYLTPFVVLTGDSYLGIKLGMSIISSLMAIPAYLLTRDFCKKLDGESKIPSLLAAFLITVNFYCYRMIEDFMQNLAGIFFLLWFIFFSIRWLEDLKQWKKYGLPTVLAFVCTIFTHVYPAGIILILAGALLLFDMIGKSIKKRKLPMLELKVLGVLAIFAIGAIIPLMLLYPTTIENYTSRLGSYLSVLTSGDTSSKGGQFQTSFLLFLTVPYILGVIAILLIFIKGLKKKIEEDKPIISKKTFLALQYLVLIILLFFLVIVPSNWQERFILLAFLPIALVVPIGMKLIEWSLLKKREITRSSRFLIIGGLSIVISISSLVNVIGFIPNMGPIITNEQYNELVIMKNGYVSTGLINSSGVVSVESYHFGYWTEYVLDMDVDSGNITQSAPNYLGRPIYQIITLLRVAQPFNAQFNTPWMPFLPLHESSLIELQQGPPPPTKGMIYRGTYYEFTLIYYSNGTKV